MVKNQRHAEKSEAMPNQKSLERIEERVKFLSRQEKEIKTDIATLLKSQPEVKQRVDNICTIPGVGETDRRNGTGRGPMGSSLSEIKNN